MNDSKTSEPIIPPMKSAPGLKDYNCPHCHKFLFRGRVKKINMVCHNCQKMIKVTENELLRQEETPANDDME